MNQVLGLGFSDQVSGFVFLSQVLGFRFLKHVLGFRFLNNVLGLRFLNQASTRNPQSCTPLYRPIKTCRFAFSKRRFGGVLAKGGPLS